MAIVTSPDTGSTARANIQLAIEIYSGIQERGSMPTVEANAHFAHIQALATIAVAQAVMHLADTVKEATA